MLRWSDKRLALSLVLAIAVLAPGTLPGMAQSKAAISETSPAKALGSKTAPIVMEVFSDFQCPACRELYQQTLRPVIENYVSANKVYLVHRDMPLPVHKYARDAARYANAAARLGKFEKVVAALYGKQDRWSADGNIEAAVAEVLTPAEMKKVREMLRDGKLDAAIDRDVSLGNMVPVRQTPTMIITHRGKTERFVGWVSYAILRLYLEDLLRQ